MDCAEAGKKGGQSRSAKKRAASARNLEVARRLRAEMSETETYVADLSAKGFTNLKMNRWLDDARFLITKLETPGFVLPKPVVLVAQPKVSE